MPRKKKNIEIANVHIHMQPIEPGPMLFGYGELRANLILLIATCGLTYVNRPAGFVENLKTIKVGGHVDISSRSWQKGVAAAAAVIFGCGVGVEVGLLSPEEIVSASIEVVTPLFSLGFCLSIPTPGAILRRRRMNKERKALLRAETEAAALREVRNAKRRKARALAARRRR